MKELLPENKNASVYKYPCVLTIAGTDPSGGAGIQADLKTFAALGCYGMSVITALVAQNTCGVKSIHNVPPEFVKTQLLTVLEDIRPDAIKIGMVPNAAVVEVIADVLESYPDIPVVLDPVMVATSGHELIQEDYIAAVKDKLFPHVTLVTPNMNEAALLINEPVKTIKDMEAASLMIMQMMPGGVLLKGGHLESEHLTSLFVDNSGIIKAFHSERIVTKNTHGTGCTLSSAIASYLARGLSLVEAVKKAQHYVHNAIIHASDVACGKGSGALNHSFYPQKMIKNEIYGENKKVM